LGLALSYSASGARSIILCCQMALATVAALATAAVIYIQSISPLTRYNTLNQTHSITAACAIPAYQNIILYYH